MYGHRSAPRSHRSRARAYAKAIDRSEQQKMLLVFLSIAVVMGLAASLIRL